MVKIQNVHLLGFFLSFIAMMIKGLSSAMDPPHIVLIFVDDLGYNDVSWHNSFVHMPTLDSLARDGVILEQAYAQEVCTPSRAALLTGYYPIHIGMQENVVTASQTSGLPLSLTLLPQYLNQTANYRSHMVGKWHLGFCNTSYTPLERGFSSHYGFYNGAIDYYDHIAGENEFTGLDYRNDTAVNRQNPGVYTTTDFTNAAIEKIQSHDPDDPMFLYMAYNAPHSPFQVNSSYMARYSQIASADRQTYLGMITALDDQILRLVNALKQYGFWNNTVFVFYSDNGGVQRANGQGGNNYPLRGRKSTLFEGGYRVPAFVTSDLLANSGYVHDGLFHVTDLFATFIYLANNNNDAAIPSGIDGQNIWEAISNNSSSPRESLVYNIVQRSTSSRPARAVPQAAIRYRNFKLIEGNPGGTNSIADWRVPSENNTDVIGTLNNYEAERINNTDYYLFDLSVDPYETNNIASSDPTNFNIMVTRLDEAKMTTVQAIDSSTTSLSDPDLYGGVWSPGFCSGAESWTHRMAIWPLLISALTIVLS